ncbi:MAG: radical SAM protein [Candidatus Korarchaeum sp.]
MLPPIASMLTSAMEHPGRISLVIFLPYCNFNCLSCHNRDLIEGRFEPLPVEKLIWELRNNFIVDFIVISGGEPTIHGKGLEELIDLIRKEREDLPIRVDSNGSSPEVLEGIADAVDGLAIDVKASPFRREKYEFVIRREFEVEKLIRSVEIASRLKYTVFRTVKYPWLTEEDLEEIREFLSVYGGGKPHLLNPYLEPPDGS